MACEKCKVVVNELLAFINHKIDVLDEVSIIQICESAFSEDDVEAAKVLLCACIPSRRPTRKRENRKTKTLQDIIAILKETDPDDVPKFVAYDLNRLPPVSFDHVDVTAFLKDLVVIKRDIAQLKDGCGMTATVDSSLVAEVQQLKLAVEQLSYATSHRPTVTPPPQLSDRIPPARVGVPANEKPSARNMNSPHLGSHVALPSVYAELHTVHAPTTALTATSTEPRAPPALGPYGSSAARPKRRRRRRNRSVIRMERDDEGVAGMSKTGRSLTHDSRAPQVHSGDSFVLVESRKAKRKRTKNKRGSVPPEECILKAASRTAFIYVSRLRRDTKVEDIVRHVEDRGERVEGVEPLTSHWADTDFSAFKLRVPAEKVKIFLRCEFWPSGVVFRRYNCGFKRQVARDAAAPTAESFVAAPTEQKQMPAPPPVAAPPPSVPARVPARIAAPPRYPECFWDTKKLKWRKF